MHARRLLTPVSFLILPAPSAYPTCREYRLSPVPGGADPPRGPVHVSGLHSVFHRNRCQQRLFPISFPSMRVTPRLTLAAYLTVMFATLPLLPPLVTAFREKLGEDALSALLYLLLAAFVLLPLRRLALAPRPRPPWPHISCLLLLLAALIVLRTLVSSPVGRIHLVEYGLLAILILRALPARNGPASLLAAFAAASVIGLADEAVQHLLPNRVFDWYDVGLNSAAALLGLLAAAWWTWTSPRRGE